MNPSVRPEHYIARSRRIAARRMGDETVIMSAVDSTLFTLNPVATAIWEAADGRTSLRQIIEQKVCADFDVAPEQALADAQQFITQLAPHNIIVVADRPIDPATYEVGA